MASLLRLFWCICLFVANDTAWATFQSNNHDIMEETAEVMAQAVLDTIGTLGYDGPSVMPNLMIYILGHFIDEYFPLGMFNEQVYWTLIFHILP